MASRLLLPPELLLLISAHLPHPQHISALVRTCHRLSHLLSPHFRTLALTAKNGTSALHWAAHRGHLPLIRLALSAPGATADLLNEDKRTPLHLAAYRDHAHICEFLLDSGADVDLPEHWTAATALYLAALRRHAGVVRVLLQRGADPDRRACLDSSPLHAALQGALEVDVGILEMLLEGGADPEVRDGAWLRPVDCAIMVELREVLRRGQEIFEKRVV